jgi:hypothetical protein
MCVRESAERAIMEESNDNPLGRPIPCNERWRRNGARSVSGSTGQISSVVVDERESSPSLGKGLFIGSSKIYKLEDGA